MGCHFLLQCMKVKSEGEVAQSCPTLRNPMDCSLSGSSIHGISQARVLEWVAIALGIFPLLFHLIFFFHKKSFPCLVILSLSFVLTPVPPQVTLLPSTPRARPFSPPPGFLSQLPTTSPTPNLPPRQGPKGEKDSQVKGPSARAEEAFSVMEERDDSEH